MHAEAAAAFEAGDSHAAAGSVYIRAGLPERAAEAYERAGEFETAARLFEQAGNQPRAMALYEKAGLTFKSGEAAAQAGDRDRAIALLQRVDPSDEHYGAATALLGQLFVESGRAGLAVERLQKAIGGKPVSNANLDLYYWLAAAHEKDRPARGHRALQEDPGREPAFPRSRRAARRAGGGAGRRGLAAAGGPAQAGRARRGCATARARRTRTCCTRCLSRPRPSHPRPSHLRRSLHPCLSRHR